MQSLPQLMPAGVLVTVPPPVPPLVTVSMSVPSVKVAVHVRSAVMATVPVVQPVPVQPAKVEPVAGVAVSATLVPDTYDSVQSDPQLRPDPVTVPLPLPAFTTARLNVGGGGVAAPLLKPGATAHPGLAARSSAS